MPANKIMLIRYAEKPEGDDAGASPKGEQNTEELIVRGWQRSGALVRLFAPRAASSSTPSGTAEDHLRLGHRQAQQQLAAPAHRP